MCLLTYYKREQTKRLELLIKHDNCKANSKKDDFVKINDILMMGYILKMVKIMITISSICYIFAMIFKFLIEIQNDYMNWDSYGNDPEEPEHFTSFYAMNERDDGDILLAYLYFSFTSLTTVGFGDYNPRSDIERAFIAFGLLFGVALFSLIMGQFIEMILEILESNKIDGDGDQLARFFGVLQNFNDQEIFNVEIKRKIEGYFDYRWDKDKNNVLNNEKYASFMEQLSEVVKDELLKQFLYEEFLIAYKVSFTFEKEERFNAQL